MSDKPASLLTKTQRDRIRAEFESVEGAKRRRDRQRIRQRIAAGIDDFQHLVAFPDDQLETAFNDYDDDELERALADLWIVTERVREGHGVDREDVMERARTRLDAVDRSERTLSVVEPQTRAEIRAAVEADHEPDTWKRRSDAALKLGTVLALPGVALIPVPLGTIPRAVDGAIVFVSAVFGGALLAVGLLILLSLTVRDDVVPTVRDVVDEFD